jgi:hypothetical protein
MDDGSARDVPQDDRPVGVVDLDLAVDVLDDDLTVAVEPSSTTKRWEPG